MNADDTDQNKSEGLELIRHLCETPLDLSDQRFSRVSAAVFSKHDTVRVICDLGKFPTQPDNLSMKASFYPHLHTECFLQMWATS